MLLGRRSSVSQLAELELEADGAELFRAALPQLEVEVLLAALHGHDHGRPGARLTRLDELLHWLGASGAVGRIAANWLGPKAAPVRAILFDKSPATNWALAWHQDRTIAVAERADLPDFTNWNRKDGVDHVEPPFGLIERMITVRIHLDQVTGDNAPLLVSPGSHRLGRIAEPDVPEVVERHRSFECLADPGDIWAYRTAILHASKRSTAPGRRRVLQVDYSNEELPQPLRWLLRR